MGNWVYVFLEKKYVILVFEVLLSVMICMSYVEVKNI